MTKYTYLLIDLLSMAVPLIFSFHRKIQFYKHWDALLPAIVITAAAYSLWDSWFTHLGVWGFNPNYITGIYLGNLPLEEMLFFVCIPYSCLFTFECLSGIIPPTLMQQVVKPLGYSIAVGLLLLAIAFHSQAYTASAFIVLAIMVFAGTVKNMSWMPKFYIVYSILLIPFLVVNGLLTGTGLASPVVWYNPSGIIGVRVLTIPIEDVFYGMGLILANVWIYLAIRKKRLAVPSIFS
ncbi:MAG TPA: lycopene cyclase domain-containing protein [Candidatus Babeliaceae bacterium]|jgi:lycopene cyclase domain-containing protein|nr:lycopene cyclase domain-containing protein [Candidatus Babeliaceae bacterium]